MDPRDLPIVLYIDDTPDARTLVSRVLEQKYLVLEASDALSGIELAMDTHPDLILLDINLPRLGGREAAARLKSLLPNTPLVAFSADISPDARERALAAGFAGYITKPIDDLDVFVSQIGDFLGGKREASVNAAKYQQQFTAEVVARLEEKVRELTNSSGRNEFLNQQNQILIAGLQRRQRLLESAARISHVITSILELDELLQVSVQVICQEYGFQYAAIFLVDAENQQAVLRSAYGESSNLLEKNRRLPVSNLSMVSRAIVQRLPQLRQTSAHLPQPSYPPLIDGCQLELALPLIVKENVLGALTLHSANLESYADEEDMPVFQVLVDQVAIAIANASLMRDLAQAHQELLRTKTFEAIATATGEAIHWVGNKAAPIPASAGRVREDVLSLVHSFRTLLELPLKERTKHSLWPAWLENLGAVEHMSSPSLLQPFTLESILEDLAIIEQSATTILGVKEDLIGPARLRRVNEIDLAELLRQAIFEMGLPDGVVTTDFAAGLPIIPGDKRQLGQVFNNLIKNAWEAMHDQSDAHIVVKAYPDEELRSVCVQVIDNGPGIPSEILDKIWVSFFTTKGDRGGTGLGLSACMAIANQHDGKITVQSQVGTGTTFTVTLPVQTK